MNDTEGTVEEWPSESDLLEIVENISVTDALSGEYGKSTQEIKTVKQRREEEPTSKPEELNPLETNVDDIGNGRLWTLLWPST